MSVIEAVSKGLRHATRSKGLIVLLWALIFAAALPFTFVIRDAVERSVGTSRVHLDLERRFDMDWYSEYSHETVGLGRLLTPTSVRPAAFLDNLEAWFSGEMFLGRPEVVALGIVFAIGWTFVCGGLFHRFAYGETQLAPRLLAAHSAELFPRFARLALITGILYYLVYRFSRWLFPWLEELMRDVTVERTALAVHLAGAAVVILLLILVRLVSDYAKASTVIDDRRSMLVAAWHAARFVARNPRTLAAYALISALGFALLAVYGIVAPGHTQSGVIGVLWAFLLSQVLMALRIVQRLTGYATAVELYRAAGD